MCELIKVVYDLNSNYILNILEKYKDMITIESYDLDYHKQRKKGISLLTHNGTKLTPLIIFYNKNGEDYKVLWSENNPNWEKEIDLELQDKLITN